jgi:twitching motility protein PilT
MTLLEYIQKAIDANASDLHLIAGSAPTLRVFGDLVKINKELLESSELEKEIRELVGDEYWQRFVKNKELDISKEMLDKRFRINLHFQENKIGFSARLIPVDVPTPQDLGFDEIIYKLTHLKDGLILVTGPSGSGKSTTLAAMLNIINKERRSHIVTIEDPIEYLFSEEQSVIEQREVGTDTIDFASALKYALRQDPNIIMVGEMRDAETIRAALIAAETGHLVLSTLHTSSAPETVKRIISVFPEHEQDEARYQLASSLRAVIDQQLMQDKKKGLVAAREVMINNPAIANLIRQNQIDQIYSVIQTGQREGMITMNKAIDRLLEQDIITEDVAHNRKRESGTMASYY